MKIARTVFNEITNMLQDKNGYLATYHSQPVYSFICEDNDDIVTMEEFIILHFSDKKVKK